MINVTVSSRPIRTKALGAKAPAFAAIAGAALTAGRWNPISRPPPAAALTLRKVLRETPPSDAKPASSLATFGIRLRPILGFLPSALSTVLRRLLDSGTDALIGATATDVAGHGRIDIGVAGVRIVRQQRGRRHDLARLAVTTLDHFNVEPSLLDLSTARRLADCLNGRDGPVGQTGRRDDAGPYRPAVDMNRTRTTLGDTTSELRSGQPDHVPQDPQQRHVLRNVQAVLVAIDLKRHHGHLLLHPPKKTRLSAVCQWRRQIVPDGVVKKL